MLIRKILIGLLKAFSDKKTPEVIILDVSDKYDLRTFRYYKSVCRIKEGDYLTTKGKQISNKVTIK